MLTEKCLTRLHNFKFRDAVDELTDDACDHERTVVTSLAIFGNPGFFLGGPMEKILLAAIYLITPDDFLLSHSTPDEWLKKRLKQMQDKRDAS